MDSQISYLTRELKNLTLRKRPNLEKKYFIDKETRNQIKKLQHITIGLIPFQSKRNPIYNPKKEFFINHTHILTKNKKMIQLTTPNKKCYLKLIKKYLESNLKIKLDLTRINKILEIEKSKVFLFTVDLTGFEIISQLSNDLLDKMSNLSLKPNYEIISLMDFYTQVETIKGKKELYQNITNLRHNKKSLQKCIPLEIESNHMIQFKYNLIYQRLY